MKGDLALPAPLLAGARAPPLARRHQPTMSGAQNIEGVGPETANKVFDPLRLADMASPKTLAWYRHAELKHGRVAMLAWTGFAYMSIPNAPLFPGAIDQAGTTFAQLGHDPFAAWAAVPLLGKTQILLTLGALEFASETEKPHYMSGGTPGKVTILGASLAPSTLFLKNKTPAEVAEKRISELKNGRLAMIGAISVFAAHNIPGSVPAFGSGALW